MLCAVAALALSFAASRAPVEWVSGTNAALLARSANASSSRKASIACSVTLEFPHCLQKCSMWCWATVVAEVRNYYSGDAPHCTADECGIVSDSLGQDCCGASECSGTCGNGGTISQIQEQLNRFHAFSYLQSALDEATLVANLQSGHPVLRLTSGHIDVVTGCGDGVYFLTDSEYSSVIKVPYSEL
eukprot:4868440-Prymnesium_polylepis.1